jgi:hypothetical protein
LSLSLNANNIASSPHNYLCGDVYYLKFNATEELNINDISDRFDAANNWFIENYPGVDPYSFFESVHPKGTFLRAFFSLLKHGDTPDLEAQLIFELQVLFLIDCAEILCEYFLSEDYKRGESHNIFHKNSDVSPEELATLLNRIRAERKKQREPLYKF